MKEIKSPVEEFSGSVILSDPLTFPQVVKWVDASNAADAVENNVAAKRMAWLPGIFACVEEWHIEGIPEDVTPETFPCTPFKAALILTNWLIGEINAIIAGEDTNPNA